MTKLNDLKAAAELALGLMDLTSLNDNDTNEVITALCQQAKTEFGSPGGNLCLSTLYPDCA